MAIREGAGMLGVVFVGVGRLCYPNRSSEMFFVMPRSSSRQEQSRFVVSFVNKGGVEVGIRRQNDGFRVEGEDQESTSAEIAVAA
jgi:hypothetical protein